LQRLPSFALGEEVDEKRNEEPLDWHHFALSFFLSLSPHTHIKRERREMSNSAENCGQSINDCLRRRVSLSFGCSGAAEWQTSEQAILTLCTPATSFAQGNTHETKKVSKRDNNVFLNLLDA
jgi:hypothetical protein